MTRTKPLSLLLAFAALALVALVAAGCGGGGDNQATASSGGSNAAGGSATIGMSNIGGLGRVLVDSQGRTVYLFEKDTGPQSTCFGACATEWPPVTTSGKPSAGSGVTASMLGTTKRSQGKTQVTYNGHPLYLFEADQKPGDATGQNVDAFGAKWYVLSPAGNKVAGTGSAGGYAY
jgi:predicted lipoprotein with Yx(FWY)xxD motif